MKHTTICEDINLIESVVEDLEEWMALPSWDGKRLFKETETVVNERLSLLHEGLSVMKAAAWLRKMAKNADAFLGFIAVHVGNDFPDAVMARTFVNWQMASTAKRALGEGGVPLKFLS